jgi:acylphosphatase
MTAPHRIHRHLRIHGLVQGVYYRAYLVKQAEALGLDGWVRNRHDGSVEALASGALEAVERLIAWAHVGPPAARVSRVEITELEDPGEPGAPFAQRPTA